jgi:hypothetical protein
LERSVINVIRPAHDHKQCEPFIRSCRATEARRYFRSRELYISGQTLWPERF